MKVTALVLALCLFAVCECRNVKRDVDRPKFKCDFLDGVGLHPFLFAKWGGRPYVITWDKDDVAFIKLMDQDPCPYASKHSGAKQPLKNAPSFDASYTSEDILKFFAEDCQRPY